MFDIINVDFPFIDSPSKSKLRPALIISKARGKHSIVVIAYVTSKKNVLLDTDVIIDSQDKSFKQTGLKRTSYIRLHRISTVQLDKIKGEIGILPEKYSKEVKEKIRVLFEL
ncbi:MAG: type II toxin-antitoxin system PemK/MazF family toxin [bacterium]|nr:type II toxin-antitoxin system PemK/MazF family toxin [bacterium]